MNMRILALTICLVLSISAPIMAKDTQQNNSYDEIALTAAKTFTLYLLSRFLNEIALRVRISTNFHSPMAKYAQNTTSLVAAIAFLYGCKTVKILWDKMKADAHNDKQLADDSIESTELEFLDPSTPPVL